MHALTGTLAAVTMLLYGAVAHADNISPSQLSDKERGLVEELLPLDMQHFKLYEEPRPFRGKTFLDPKGKRIDLSAFDGGMTVVNFWATWCPPCRKELPWFDELQAELGEEGIRVVTISLDKQGRGKAKAYLDRQKLTNLQAYTDPKADLAREMGILGLPVTVILGPDGREIGRLTGEAKWNSVDAKAWLRAIAEMVSDRQV